MKMVEGSTMMKAGGSAPSLGPPHPAAVLDSIGPGGPGGTGARSDADITLGRDWVIGVVVGWKPRLQAWGWVWAPPLL